MFLIAVVVFTVASMLCGLAPNARAADRHAVVLQAVGAAALVPSSLALVLQTFPREKIPVAVAIWGAIGAVAGAAGPTLGALVVENLSWRWAFFINLPVGIISFMLGRAVLPEGREANPGRLPDAPASASSSAASAWPPTRSSRPNTWGWGSARVRGHRDPRRCLARRSVRVRCQRVDNPLLDLGLFRSRNFRWANAGDTRLRDSASTRCSSATSCSSRRCGTTRPAGRAGHLGRSAHRGRDGTVLRQLAGRIGQRALLCRAA